MRRKFSLACALILGGAILTLQASGQTKRNATFFVIRITHVGLSSGFYSGQLECDLDFDGVVVRSTAHPFPLGVSLHILVPTVGDSLIFKAHEPAFDETKIAIGKLLWIKATKACIDSSMQNDLKIDASCIQPIQK
jgi:hypothetical protein